MVRWYMPATDIEIFFDCGAQDEYYLNLHNQALSDTLKRYGIKHEYTEYTGDHTSGLVFRIPISFRNIDRVFKGHQTQARLLEYNEQIVKLFPNPTNGLLFFEPENPEDLDYITISGLDGKVIRKVKASENPINLESFSPGIYMAFFHFKKTTSGFRIIRLD